MIKKIEQSDSSLSHYFTSNVHTQRNFIEIGEFYRMWKGEILDVLLNISDFLEVLREIPEITTGIF